jgi:hypothetical protein
MAPLPQELHTVSLLSHPSHAFWKLEISSSGVAGKSVE